MSKHPCPISRWMIVCGIACIVGIIGITLFLNHHLRAQREARVAAVTEQDAPVSRGFPELAAPIQHNNSIEPRVAIVHTEEELDILALIIYQEAGGDTCSDNTRLMVGNVFLNRVEDDNFPNTFKEVAEQNKQYGNLAKTGIKWPTRATSAIEQHAVGRAYATAALLLEGERILPEDVIWQAEFIQGKETYAYQDNLYFCR